MDYETLKRDLTKDLPKELSEPIIGILDCYKDMGLTPEEALEKYAEQYKNK